VPQVHAARRAGAFVAVIDPRRTPLARSADMHLAPRPGTDVVLALSMIHELVRRGRTDEPFLAAHTTGFAPLARAAAAYPVERAAALCDVPPDEIERLVGAYAAASPAVIRCGWGVERNRNGGNAVRAIFALPAVAGKFGVRGGGLTMSLSRAFPVNSTALARPDLRRGVPRQVNMTQLGRVLTDAHTPPIRALFVYNANPVAMAPNQNVVIRGLAREDLFTVVHDQVLTDTARFADIVLPATTVFEHHDLHKSYGHYYLQYSKPVIAPVGESLSNRELFTRLAQAMGFSEPALSASDAELLAVALDGQGEGFEGVGDITREKLAHVRFGTGRELIQCVTDGPTTPSGKIELSPASLGVPIFQPMESGFPLTLLSPATNKTINSIFGELNARRAALVMHPQDAAQRGLGDGDLVRVYNDLGELHVPLDISEDVRPGVVTVPKGLWRSATVNGSTATALAPDHLTDIGEGACFNDARVEVARLSV